MFLFRLESTIQVKQYHVSDYLLCDLYPLTLFNFLIHHPIAIVSIIENVVSDILAFTFSLSFVFYSWLLFNLKNHPSNYLMYDLLHLSSIIFLIDHLIATISTVEEHGKWFNTFCFYFFLLPLVIQFEAYHWSIHLVCDLFFLELFDLLNYYPVRITLRIE